jgi:hypothetical protein
MAYVFDGDETVPEAVQRITDEQVERAVSALEQAGGDGLDAAVHDCRKRAKKLRGLLRLVRPALGKAYGQANESFRDAGRELSGLRDAQAALATFDGLIVASPDRLPEGGVGAVRAGIAALAEEAARAGDGRLRAECAADLFRAGRRHVARAELNAEGWAAVGPGVEMTYRAGRRALADARRDTEPTVMHHNLSDALGDAHDLVVITDHLRASPDRFGGDAQIRAICELADTRRAELERRAMSLGARLYAEKPSRYADRMGAYWHLWHETGDEKPAGGLADLFPPTDDLDVLDLEELRDRADAADLPAHLYPSKAQLIGELRAAGAS